ncbi:SpoIIE family protein phosphatase [Streptomyces brasiliensis]|uniref:protein-serine/threonine phosphatase n=1 Tax=Streptomyces brasiliensis TaxID=1954 RepID=A0A917UMY8_9ACTN|nr:SpoIIE family protein phosphatase [Streptomyces brasiliensis]GGJ69195.1 hypothetical protein GCM10010121_094950 [Streptomyces brasiliensis]
MHARLALLDTVEAGTAEGELLRLVLQQAVSELRGLGGAVHLCGPMGVLRLVSATGLPAASVREWEIIGNESTQAPALAVRRDSAVWELAAAGAQATAPWPGAGLAAVPLSHGRGPVGALTIVTGAEGKPGKEQWDFLEAAAAWAQRRMADAPPLTRLDHGGPSADRLRQALDASRVGTWEWDLRTDELIWDDAAMSVYGTRPEEFVPRTQSWMKVVHPDDLPWTLAAVEKAIHERGVFEAEYRVRRRGGGYGWTRARGRVLVDDNGEPCRMVGTAWDSHETREARDALSRALRHMSDGFLSVGDDWRIAFVNLKAEGILGSTEEELYGRVLWTLPAVRQIAGMEARCREAAAAASPTGFDVRMPGTGKCYHLRVVPVPDGVTLYLTDVTDTRRHDAERRARERAAAERAARTAELTAALATATTSRDVVSAVARRVLPPFAASGLMVQVVDGDRVRNVGAVGYTSDYLDWVEGRPKDVRNPVWDAISTGEPLFVSTAEEFAARYPDLADHPDRSGKQAWVFVPLTASGRCFGACVLSFDQPRRLTDEERTLLTTISALLAHALERARLYDAEHTRSQELQRALLPRRLPDLSACTAAARYLPAGQGMDVGGDWYDVIPLSAGRVALVVGDVMGHGLSEAATMGRLRTAVHTLAALELPPDEIMAHLNDIVADLGEDSYATCLYALYDSTSGTCSLVRAGHPPPAVVHPDGTVHFPDVAADPPLGAAEPPFQTTDVVVAPESLLVLYSDGLVESSEREIDQGMADLARLLRASYDKDLQQLCDDIVAGICPRTADDDIALLVARVHALAAVRMASWPLPADPRAAGQARRHVREQLGAWGLEDLSETTELLASELVGNVVRHASGPMRLRLLCEADLVCEVFDGSLTMPRIRHASETDEGGRGLQLVATLSQRWGTRYTAAGKCIWTAQALSAAPVSILDGFDMDAIGPL